MASAPVTTQQRDIDAFIRLEKKRVACRIYYDKNREAILAQQMRRYMAIREERIAKGEAKKRGPKSKPRVVTIPESIKAGSCAL